MLKPLSQTLFILVLMGCQAWDGVVTMISLRLLAAVHRRSLVKADATMRVVAAAASGAERSLDCAMTLQIPLCSFQHLCSKIPRRRMCLELG